MSNATAHKMLLINVGIARLSGICSFEICQKNVGIYLNLNLNEMKKLFK
jgi:hypothetical protein